MAKTTTTKKAETVKAEPETLKFKIEFPDGTVSEGTVTMREFAPNVAKGFRNSGFQTKISSGNYSGSLMVIDYLKKVKL
jgi:hypothetical protein